MAAVYLEALLPIHLVDSCFSGGIQLPGRIPVVHKIKGEDDEIMYQVVLLGTNLTRMFAVCSVVPSSLEGSLSLNSAYCCSSSLPCKYPSLSPHTLVNGSSPCQLSSAKHILPPLTQSPPSPPCHPSLGPIEGESL